MLLISNYRNPLKIRFQNSPQDIIVQEVIKNKKKWRKFTLFTIDRLSLQNEYPFAMLSNYFSLQIGGTLYLMIDKVLESTLLKLNRSGSAASFSVNWRHVQLPAASDYCLKFFKI